MAVPFYIPDEEESSTPSSSPAANQQENNSQNTSAASSAPNTPSRPIPIPQPSSSSSSQQNSPQMSPINNEMLVQAFYEALCRCNFPPSPMPSSSPSSPFNRGHFYFPSPSPSTVSSPRNSFRGPPRRRLNSYGSQSQYSQFSEEQEIENECDLMEWENHYQQREHLEEFSGQIPQPKAKKITREENNQKPKESSSKITSFVISALQFVIDTLR